MKQVGVIGVVAALSAGRAFAWSTLPPVAVEAVFTVQAPTIEGCLLAGSASGEFIVSAGGERHTVVAGDGVDLAAHVSHRVQLTGTIEKGASGPVFRVSALTMVATSCAAA